MKNKICLRLAADLQIDSIVDGTGIRTVIWTQGCNHRCLGCHNPNTHSFDEGVLVDIEEIKQEISTLEGQDGITFSGGDPFYQPEACYYLAKYIHELKMNVWCYTGFTYEQLVIMSNKDPYINKFLNEIDVLVDGPFILSQKSYDLKFRGSRNQRLIDVKKTLKKGKVVILNLEEKEEKIKFGRANKKMYI